MEIGEMTTAQWQDRLLLHETSEAGIWFTPFCHSASQGCGFRILPSNVASRR
jgi:hypothetical protein